MAEVCTLDWNITPFRSDRWLEVWEPAAARMPAFGALSWSIIRSVDDPLSFRLASSWNDRADFERFWFSDEIATAREEVINFHDLPVLPAWHTVIAAE